MNTHDREAIVSFGQAATAYAIFRDKNRSLGESVIDNAYAQGVITRYAVTQNTGDRRLGRLAGASAGARTFGMGLAMFAVPGAAFLGPILLGMAAGVDLAALSPLFCFVWLPFCFGLLVFMSRKTSHTYSRNYYARNALPSTWELNKTGYWEVEQDVWFNPVTERVLHGHAYNGREAAAGRQAYRDESQQIRDLYRQMKGQSGASGTPARPAIRSAGDKPQRGLRNADGGLWWS
jgi:hypothetical protein